MNLEQCQKLREWGMEWVGTCACPDLEELLEFAWQVVEDKIGVGAVIVQKWFPKKKSFHIDYGNQTYINVGTNSFWAHPDPKQAIYKLLEKIQGEAPTKELRD